ncbi:hypothetical protein CMQ_2493 [Grosmannia clavigera kw1407]|uniref:Hemerythrin-like domain-containing protein n=1 Tax=Grosmannia clavigera (strain kw1407 / UAMH 11150) TaxID=655863 RepID=F0XIX4_GROCL|nr:uncharacterized protein CMQ_2493 [Grosmannia clavigera kw1407]EFX02444.1 hypothetical protein CMQ_2493 [Grosmannia clavigera kw1407]
MSSTPLAASAGRSQAADPTQVPVKEKNAGSSVTGLPTGPEGPVGQAEVGTSEKKLPALSRENFRKYNRLAEHMDYFHNHFRQIWTLMYNACLNNKRPASMSVRQFIEEGLQLVHMLEMHHSIEETHVFPTLAKRMPEFQAVGVGKVKGLAKAAQLLQQHRDIHVGMDGLEKYLRQCGQRGTEELDLAVLKAQMDTWGDVLWQHLDDEVRTLGADNMRKYWSLAEMQQLRM